MFTGLILNVIKITLCIKNISISSLTCILIISKSLLNSCLNNFLSAYKLEVKRISRHSIFFKQYAKTISI